MTAADAAAYASDQRQGQSVVQVVRGEKLTELQALLEVAVAGQGAELEDGFVAVQAPPGAGDFGS